MALGGELGNLIVKVESDISALKKGLNEGTKTVNDFSYGAAANLGTLATAFVAMGVAASAAILKISQASIRYGAELDKVSKIANSTASEIARLTYAVQQEGGSVETLNRSIPILARNMQEAARGTKEQADAFRDLGVNVRNNDGSLKTTTQVFAEIADGVEKSRNRTQALADTMKVLGRGAADLYPLLLKGGEGIRELGIEFDKLGFSGSKLDNFSADAKRLDDIWTSIKMKFQLAGAALTSELLPAFEQLSLEFLSVDWVGIAMAVGAIAQAFLNASMALSDLIAKSQTLPAWLKQLITQGPSGLAQNIGAAAAPAGGAALQGVVVGGAGALGQAAGTQLSGGAGGGGKGGAPQAPGGGATTPASQSGKGAAGAGGGGGNSISAVIQGLDYFAQKLSQTLTNARSQISSFQQAFIEMGVQLTNIFTKAIGTMFDTFGSAFAGMLVYGQSFSDGVKQGFQSLAASFISAVTAMIVKWLAFVAAVMVIALILQVYGVSIGTTFKAAFKMIDGGGGGDSGGGGGGGFSAANFGKGLLKKAFSFREGGAIMARNGLYTAAAGLGYMTGSYGDGGIDAVIHPNEVVTPIDKLFDLVKEIVGQNGGMTSIYINGYNRDPRELAQYIATETDRKRRGVS